MPFTDWEKHLRVPSPRSIHVLQQDAEESNAIVEVAQQLRFELFHVKEANVRSKEELLRALAKEMRFPYFGYNWDALLDCMRDLSWCTESSGFILLFETSIVLLEHSPSDFITFIQVAEDAADSWRARRIPFHVILVDSDVLGRVVSGAVVSGACDHRSLR